MNPIGVDLDINDFSLEEDSGPFLAISARSVNLP
jgi:hypothetical protein